MHSFEVNGGRKLSGDIIPQGAKNEALPNYQCSNADSGKVTITNIPDILDVNLLIELLGEMNECEDRQAQKRYLYFPGR